MYRLKLASLHVWYTRMSTLHCMTCCLTHVWMLHLRCDRDQLRGLLMLGVFGLAVWGEKMAFAGLVACT